MASLYLTIHCAVAIRVYVMEYPLPKDPYKTASHYHTHTTHNTNYVHGNGTHYTSMIGERAPAEYPPNRPNALYLNDARYP